MIAVVGLLIAEMFSGGRCLSIAQSAGRLPCAGQILVVLLISSTLIIGAITGFVFFSGGEFFFGFAGQAVHGLFSTVCFALVGVAFWCFGWKVGVINLVLVVIAANAGLSFRRHFRKRSGL